MNSIKRISMSKVFLFVYILVLLSVGLPFANGEKTQGILRSEAFADNGLSRLTYSLRVFNAIIPSILLIVVCVSWLFSCYLIKRLNTSMRIKQFSKVLTIRLWFEVLMVIYQGYSSILYMANALTAKSDALYEFSRSSFVAHAGLLLLFVKLLLDTIEMQKNYARKSTNAIIADFWLQQYRKHIKNDNIENAGLALENACKEHPSGVSSWAVRAVFTNVHLKTPSEADAYFNRATKNLTSNPDISNKERAVYEFCMGNMLLGIRDDRNAILHIKESLKLDYVKEKANLLKKLENSVIKP